MDRESNYISIGANRVSCSPIQNVDFKKFLRDQKVQVLYSDPPWGNGALKMFATMNKKATGVDIDQINHEQLVSLYKEIIENHVQGFVFIETGIRWRDEFKTMMQGCLSGIREDIIQYKSRGKFHKNAIIYGNNIETETPRLNLTGRSGFSVPEICVSSVGKKGEIVLDPCCGFGLTARAALRSDMLFYGNELNHKRLDKTITEIEKHG